MQNHHAFLKSDHQAFWRADGTGERWKNSQKLDALLGNCPVVSTAPWLSAGPSSLLDYACDLEVRTRPPYISTQSLGKECSMPDTIMGITFPAKMIYCVSLAWWLFASIISHCKTTCGSLNQQQKASQDFFYFVIQGSTYFFNAIQGMEIMN